VKRKLWIYIRFSPASFLLYLSLGLLATAVLAANTGVKSAPTMKGGASPAVPGPSTAIQSPNSYPSPAPVIPELDCLIEPYMTVELATTVSGIVKVVNVDRGDIIRSGQILAQLDVEVEKANVARERARAEFTAKKSHRMQELFKEQMVSAQQMEEAKADSDLAAAELKKAIEILNQRTVFSPFNGVVTDRYVSPGELVENKKILKVAQINPLSVEVIAPIAMLGEFKSGAKMQVVPEGPVAGPFEARVRLVDRVIDAPSGTFRVRLALPNPKHQISAGVRCKARLIKSEPEKPKSAAPKAKASKAKTSKHETDRKPRVPMPKAPKVDAPKVEAVRTDTLKADVPKELAPKSEEPRTEPPKTGATKSEAPSGGAKADVPSAEAPKVEVPKTEATGGGVPKSDTPKAEPPNEKPSAAVPEAGSPKPETPPDKTPNAEVSNSESPKGETPDGDPATANAPKAEAAKQETPGGETPVVEVPRNP
jgi:multidrug efflux pump subunit AcrA (membrane-fusion protein)